MSPKLQYLVTIENIYNNTQSCYHIQGPIKQVVDRINFHYGCAFISHAGVCNIITRPHVVAARFRHVQIERSQCRTKKYPLAEGGRHKPVVPVS
jgi:hypothetical protein